MMFGALNIIFDVLSYVVPALIILVAFKLVAAMTKGYKNFLDAVHIVFSSWKSFAFFIIIVGVMIFFWYEIKGIFGMV